MSDHSYVKVAHHQIVDETLKSIVMRITIPGGSGVKRVIRVPKALCKGWTNTHVNIYGKYFVGGVTEVSILPRTNAAQEFDEPAEVLPMPLRYVQPNKQWVTDEVMSAFSLYERHMLRG